MYTVRSVVLTSHIYTSYVPDVRRRVSGFFVGSVRRRLGGGGVCVKLLLYLCQCIVLFTHDTSISDQEMNRESTVLRLGFRYKDKLDGGR